MMVHKAAAKIESEIIRALAQFQSAQRAAMNRDGLSETEIVHVLHEQRAQFLADAWCQAREAVCQATGHDIGTPPPGRIELLPLF